MKRLQDKLGHQFLTPALLKQALSHRSSGRDNNERLEFLGDAVLGLIAAEALYQRFPELSEGELSRLRATLVQQGTLAEIARELRFGEHLILGLGEQKSGGAERDSILADTLEAVICALYLDAGLERCKALVLPWFIPRIPSLRSGAMPKDAKTGLQELLQSRHAALPTYEVVEVTGQDHQQVFTVRCSVALLGTPCLGQGGSRKMAEQQAAEAALLRLERGHDG